MKFSSTQLVAILLATGAQAQNNDLGNIINGAASIINGIGPGVQSALTVVGGALNPNQPTQSGTPTVVNTPTATVTGGAETTGSSGQASSGQASSSQGASAAPGGSATSGSVKPTGSAKSSTTSAPSGNSASSLSAPNQYMVVAGAAIAAFGTYFV